MTIENSVVKKKLENQCQDPSALVKPYLFPQIHKRLDDIPGRLGISNCGYYIENISIFLDFHLQTSAQAGKSHIKNTNDFFIKLSSSPKLPSDMIYARQMLLYCTLIFCTRRTCLLLGRDWITERKNLFQLICSVIQQKLYLKVMFLNLAKTL